MILIDTSALIEFLNHTSSPFDKEITSLIENDDDVCLADIVVTEVLQGIKNEKEYSEIKDSILSFPIFSLKGIESYINAAELYRKCRKKGFTVRSTVDLLIAQIALENDLTLLHNDNDFLKIAKVSGLKIYNIRSK